MFGTTYQKSSFKRPDFAWKAKGGQTKYWFDFVLSSFIESILLIIKNKQLTLFLKGFLVYSILLDLPKTFAQYFMYIESFIVNS